MKRKHERRRKQTMPYGTQAHMTAAERTRLWEARYGRTVKRKPAPAHVLAQLEAVDMDPSADMQAADLHRCVLRAMDLHLTRIQYAVLHLRYFEGMQHDEIGEVLDMTKQGSHMIIDAALERLRFVYDTQEDLI